MPANVEIKATLRDRGGALATAARLADSGPEIIQQEDYFFHCRGARLKLRIFDTAHGELIFYQREDGTGPRLSHYSIARTTDPQILYRILARTLGVLGTIRKTRTLYLAGQTRIHIDQIPGLGDFLELEVVLHEGQSREDGKNIANRLLAEFGISSEEAIAVSYLDLVLAKRKSRG